MARIQPAQSALSTPTMMFSSLEPWSIMITLMPASESALNNRAEVPIVFAMPCPTVGDERDALVRAHGIGMHLPADILHDLFQDTALQIVIVDDHGQGVDAGGQMLEGNAVAAEDAQHLRRKPHFAVHHGFFQKDDGKILFSRDAGHGAAPRRFLFAAETMSVPSSAGRKVLQMRMGMPALRTGKIDSLCRTLAPI